eukprot:TRINITY_DN45398_c0_g1_i1.p1 TRINITY_DN45398_c0_g1~~TRINITY_DN45398_c0_g1_i1.p1  ORF type:complete len:383 (+),score=50.30 TRINITY_DN45398_c0_g1_i1:79-1149(+)
MVITVGIWRIALVHPREIQESQRVLSAQLAAEEALKWCSQPRQKPSGMQNSELQEYWRRNGRCLAAKKNHWLVIIGDSNWRHVFWRLKSRLEFAGFKSVAEEVSFTSNETSNMCQAGRAKRCCPSWFDRDVSYKDPNPNVISEDDGQFRISFRFAICAELRLAHFASHPSKIQQCCETAKSVSYLLGENHQTCQNGSIRSSTDAFVDGRWRKPDTLVMTHGLWNVKPINGCRSSAGKCVSGEVDEAFSDADLQELRRGTPRHVYIAKRLAKLQQSGISVHWATNFCVNWMVNLNNSDLHEDLQCQKEAAAKYKIPVLDVFRHTCWDTANRVERGAFHFQEVVMDELLVEIFDRLAG